MPSSGFLVSGGVSILGLQTRFEVSKKAKIIYANHCTVRNTDIFQCFCDTTLTGQMLLPSGGARWVPGSLTSGAVSSVLSSRFPDLPTPTSIQLEQYGDLKGLGTFTKDKAPSEGRPAHLSAAALTSAHPRVFALPQTHPNPLELACGAKWQSLSTF